MRWVEPRTLPAVLFVLLVALLLRLHGLDAESLFMDEIRQVSYYAHGLGEIVELAASQQQPPLDYWIGHLVFQLDRSDFAARLPAALFGAASAGLLVLLAARHLGTGPTTALGLLYALMPFPIYYAQDARPYAIAIFFFLLLLLVLRWALTASTGVAIRLALVCLVTFLFLLTRTLAPLVVVMALGGLLLLWLMLPVPGVRRVPDVEAPIPRGRVLAVLGAMGLGVLLDLPFLLRILELGGRYASDPGRVDLAVLGHGLERFTLAPFWGALQAQAEPLGWALAGLVAAAPIALWLQPPLRRDPFAWGLLLLLPLTACLHSLVFHAKTDFPLRPPYAIYLLPLALVLAGMTLRGLLGSLKTRARRMASLVLIAVVGLAVLPTTLAMKAYRSKTDWRGLAELIRTQPTGDHVLIFDALVSDGSWEPTFYGLPRYLHESINGISVRDVPRLAERLWDLDLEPVLILFEPRDYRLTPWSPYPVHPYATRQGRVDRAALLEQAGLDVQLLTGFVVLRLHEPPPGLAPAMRALLARTLPLLPADETAEDQRRALRALDKPTRGSAATEAGSTEDARP